MKKLISETIKQIDKLNTFLKYQDPDFDPTDVVETIEGSKKRLSRFLEELKDSDFDDTKKINKLIVHIELEYSNFVWAFQEIRDHVNKILVKYPD